MADQVRYNAGKLKLGYWLGTRAFFLRPSEDSMDLSEMTEAECIEADLALFTVGDVTERDLVEGLKEILGDDRVGQHFVAACEYGEKKYWRGGFVVGAPISQYIDSAARHLKALRTSGVEYEETYTKDGETFTVKLNHWDGVCWNIVMIYEVMYHAPERDDRLFKMGDYSGNKPMSKELIEALNNPTVPDVATYTAAARQLAEEDVDFNAGSYPY